MIDEPVNIPSVDAAVEARCDEESITLRELNVLHPVGVALQSADTGAQVASVPQCNSAVITTRRKHS